MLTGRTTLIATPEDVKWLREVHLPKDAPQFRYAVLTGNEDCPIRVELRSSNRIDVPAVAIYESDPDGHLKRFI